MAWPKLFHQTSNPISCVMCRTYLIIFVLFMVVCNTNCITLQETFKNASRTSANPMWLDRQRMTWVELLSKQCRWNVSQADMTSTNDQEGIRVPAGLQILAKQGAPRCSCICNVKTNEHMFKPQDGGFLTLPGVNGFCKSTPPKSYLLGCSSEGKPKGALLLPQNYVSDCQNVLQSCRSSGWGECHVLHVMYTVYIYICCFFFVSLLSFCTVVSYIFL